MDPHEERAGADEREQFERVAAGDEEATAALFQQHRDFVFRVAFGTCARREDAVEIVQEVFLALIREAPTLRLDGARLTTWLYRVARNKAVDVVRRDARAAEGEAHDEEADRRLAPDSILLARQRSELLRRAVPRLPERAREVFVLRIGLGLSVAETARLTDCAPGAVRTALHDAKTRLQEWVERAERHAGEKHARRQAVR